MSEKFRAEQAAFNSDPVERAPKVEMSNEAPVDTGTVSREDSAEKRLQDKRTEYARVNQDLARAKENLQRLADASAALDAASPIDVWDVQRKAALQGPRPDDTDSTYIKRNLEERRRTVADISSRKERLYLQLKELGETRFATELDADLSIQNNDSTGAFDLVDSRQS